MTTFLELTSLFQDDNCHTTHTHTHTHTHTTRTHTHTHTHTALECCVGGGNREGL